MKRNQRKKLEKKRKEKRSLVNTKGKKKGFQGEDRKWAYKET